MCTVVLLRRPDHDWPLILLANRDEMGHRPWKPPARHWPDRPEVIAGIDVLAGGSWLGMNDHGVLAGILNRKGSLGPDPDLRSRGELVLEALDHADAAEAATAIAELNGHAYRSFNLVVADNRDAFWIKSLGPDGDGTVSVARVPEGVSMVTAFDLNDRESARVAFYLPRFEAAAPPDPASGDWRAWQALAASRETAPGEGPGEAMTVVTDRGFGTLSSSMVALPAIGLEGAKPVWLFATGRPGEAPYSPVYPDATAVVQA